ncbi:MAG: hypothetical protein ACJ79R_02150 [Anaeromyxobacteraceae bacterium]
MAIHVRKLDQWKQLASAAQERAPRGAYDDPCARCAALGAAVLQLAAEVELLRAPYAKAFRDGASGALDFAARAFEAMGERRSATVLREMQGVVGNDSAAHLR